MMSAAPLFTPSPTLLACCRRRLGVLSALLLAALLTACASPITTQVTSFNQWPADMAGSTFSYITPVEPTRELEQATYEGYVQTELERRGLRRAAPGQTGRLQVAVEASRHSDEKTWLQPVYQDNLFSCRPTATPAAACFREAGRPTLSGHAMWATGR